MAEELVDIYNDGYEHQGVMPKSEARKKGYWVTSIHCWIINAQLPGYVLFQKRGADKLIFPNALDISAAGHYKAGEEVKDGVREISEELSLKVDFSELIPLGVKFDVGMAGENVVREFCHVFFLISKESPSDYKVNEGEVEGLVQIRISDGLALFSGEKNKVTASGIEYDKKPGIWKDISIQVNQELFIPRTDPYYYKIFIMAERLLKGNKYVAI